MPLLKFSSGLSARTMISEIAILGFVSFLAQQFEPAQLRIQRPLLEVAESLIDLAWKKSNDTEACNVHMSVEPMDIDVLDLERTVYRKQTVGELC